MAKKSRNKAARARSGRPSRRSRGIFNKRTAAAVVLAPLVALALVAFLVGNKGSLRSPPSSRTPQTSATAIQSPQPVISPASTSTCSTAPLGRVLESFDSAQGWSLIAGTATLSVAGSDKREGALSWCLDSLAAAT